MVIFLENLIQSLPETVIKKIAERINISEKDEHVIRKRLFNAFSSEAFLIKNVGKDLDVLKEIMDQLFKSGGVGVVEDDYESELKSLIHKGLIFPIKRDGTGKIHYLIPFEFYFVSEFFHPSYFSLLYALQHYEDEIVNTIANFYGIEARGFSKIVVSRKIYEVVTKNISWIKENLNEKEKKLLEEMHYTRDKEYWKKLFLENIEMRGKKDEKVYIKELFFNSDRSSPLYSLLMKTILIPVADRTKLFVEELTVPVELDSEIFKDLREKEKEIVCQLRDVYLKEEDNQDCKLEFHRDFIDDVKRMLLYLVGKRIKATTTKKVYFKDKRRICDYFNWEDEYFDVLWDFISYEHFLDINPYTRVLKFSTQTYDVFIEDKNFVFKRVYDFFFKYGKCSSDIKYEVLKELSEAYPCYIDVHYFIEISKRISSDLSRVAIKEEMPPDYIFEKLYRNLYFLGLAISKDKCIFNLKLHENTYKLFNKEPIPKKIDVMEKPSFNEDNSTFTFPISLKREVLGFVLKTGDISDISNNSFKVKFKRERFEEFIKDEENAEFISSILEETFSEKGEKLLSEFYDKSIFE